MVGLGGIKAYLSPIIQVRIYHVLYLALYVRITWQLKLNQSGVRCRYYISHRDSRGTTGKRGI